MLTSNDEWNNEWPSWVEHNVYKRKQWVPIERVSYLLPKIIFKLDIRSAPMSELVRYVIGNFEQRKSELGHTVICITDFVILERDKLAELWGVKESKIAELERSARKKKILYAQWLNGLKVAALRPETIAALTGLPMACLDYEWWTDID